MQKYFKIGLEKHVNICCTDHFIAQILPQTIIVINFTFTSNWLIDWLIDWLINWLIGVKLELNQYFNYIMSIYFNNYSRDTSIIYTNNEEEKNESGVKHHNPTAPPPPIMFYMYVMNIRQYRQY